MKCVFHHNGNFYDFTPFKIIYPNPTAPYFDGLPVPQSTDVKYWFEFGWCQRLQDINEQVYCREDFFAGRLDAQPAPTASSPCQPYSGASARTDIVTEEIKGVPLTLERINNLNLTELNGVKLTYSGGPACPNDAKGRSMQFSLRMYCDPDMAIDGFDISAGVMGDLCHPFIDSVSYAACPNLVVGKLWEYLVEYRYYIGAPLLILGICFLFFGRKFIKPAACIAGFFTVLAFSCFLYYTVAFDRF